jgi:hypothetical protein
METLYDAAPGAEIGLQLHDPLTIWYLITEASHTGEHRITLTDEMDVRIETAGQWTRGMCVVDRRNRKKMPPEAKGDGSNWVDGEKEIEILGDGNEKSKPDDHGGWLGANEGNRVRVAVSSTAVETFGELMVKRIFGTE